MVDALIDLFDAEDAFRYFAVNSTHDVDSAILEIYAHLCNNILFVREREKPARVLLKAFEYFLAYTNDALSHLLLAQGLQLSEVVGLRRHRC